MTTRLTADNLAPTLVTAIVQGGGPKISNIFVANATYNLTDDTVISLDGGYIIINGTGFESNINVLVDEAPVVSATRISDTEIRAQLPALSSGSKIVYLVNTDNGGTAIRVNGVSYSGTPTWVTGSTLPEGIINELISIPLSANSDSNVAYQVQSGSTLPAGLTLAANGLLSGTITGITDETLYNFTVEATDEENQESSRSFSITITVGDEYFYATTLLLNGDGANGAQNNTFSDSSNNNLSAGVTGIIIQGTFSPFSATNGGSGYFDGGTGRLSYSASSLFNLGTTYTAEFWIYLISYPSEFLRILMMDENTSTVGWALHISTTGGLDVGSPSSLGGIVNSGANTIGLNQWHHVAVSRNGSVARLYANGAKVGENGSPATQAGGSPTFKVGYDTVGTVAGRFTGWISDIRIIKNEALYTGNTYTVPTESLTSNSNTSILLNFSNAGIIDYTGKNNLRTIGNAQIDTGVKKYGTGSIEFDGTGDYIVQPASNNYGYGTGDFTIEFWLYLNSTVLQTIFSNLTGVSSTNPHLYLNTTIRYYTAGADRITGAALSSGQWYYITLCRSSGSTRVFINGEQSGSTYTDANNYGSTAPLGIGTYWDAGAPHGSSTLNGYIDDLRITKGVARYASNFTPPNKAHLLQ